MNKYTELSDFEINKKVASHYLPCDYNLNEHTKTVELIGFLGDTDEYNVYATFDPCNNPADAMPIIIENRVAIFPIETLGVKYWCAASDFEDIGEKEIIWGIEANNKNPLRAAMEVYLLMNGK